MICLEDSRIIGNLNDHQRIFRMSSGQRVTKDKVVSFAYQIIDPSGEIADDEVSVKLLPSECAWVEADPDLILTDTLHNIPAEYRRVGAEV